MLRDRAPLFVTLSDGSIRNGYTFKILNKTREARSYTLEVSGLPEASISIVAAGDTTPVADAVVLDARPDTVATYRLYLAAPRSAVAAESTSVRYHLTDLASGSTADNTSSFLGPKR